MTELPTISRATTWRRIWIAYAGISTVLIAVGFTYGEWRQHSLQPLSLPVDLTKAGTYTFTANGFYASPYHPEFALRIPFNTGLMNWFPSQDYRELWAGAPPVIQLRVTDNDGRMVLSETSALTRSDGWIVTGANAATSVEIYKIAEFTGHMFGSYKIRLTVVRGSPHSTAFQPVFHIAAVKEYALLPVALGVLALIALVVLIGVVLAIAYSVERRRANAG